MVCWVWHLILPLLLLCVAFMIIPINSSNYMIGIGSDACLILLMQSILFLIGF